MQPAVINILEKAKIIAKPVYIALAKEICVNISFYDFKSIIICLKSDDIRSAYELMKKIFDKGYSVLDILTNFFVFIKQTDILAEKIKYEIIKLICEYTTIFHTIHEDDIELIFFLNELNIKINTV